MDNIRPERRLDWSNSRLAGHFDRLFLDTNILFSIQLSLNAFCSIMLKWFPFYFGVFCCFAPKPFKKRNATIHFIKLTVWSNALTNANDIQATFLLCGGEFWSRARQRKRSSFTDVHFWTSMQTMGCETNVCRFCLLITQIIFFVIPKVCLTVCVLHFLNLESLKRIYASLFTFGDKF